MGFMWLMWLMWLIWLMASRGVANSILYGRGSWRRDVGRRFRRRHSGNGETGRSSVLQGCGGSKSRSPKLAVLLAVRQMLPHTVPRLLRLAVGARRVVDALGITGCAAEPVFEGVDRGGGGRGQADSESRRETNDGGPTIRWLRRT